MKAGPGSVVAHPPAGNIGMSVDGGGWSVARDRMGWNGTHRGWGILKRGRARRVAARGGRRGDGKRPRDGVRCSATRLDSARHGRGAQNGARDGALDETKGMAGGGEGSEAAA